MATHKRETFQLLDMQKQPMGIVFDLERGPLIWLKYGLDEQIFDRFPTASKYCPITFNTHPDDTDGMLFAICRGNAEIITTGYVVPYSDTDQLHA